MLEFFRRLFSRSAKPAAVPSVSQDVDRPSLDDFARLNSQVPLQTADNGQNAFVRREAILNCAEKVAGYEFSILTRSQARRLRRGGVAKLTYDGALLDRLSLYGVSSLLGHRLALVNLSPESLNNPLIDCLRPDNTVLVLDVAEQKGSPEDLPGRIAELKEKGFALGVRIVEASDTSPPLIGHADFVQVDVTAFNGLDLRMLARQLKKPRPDRKAPLQLVARDVQSHDDYQFCRKCGFDLFQGPFVSSRESLRPTSTVINRMVLLPILGMVSNDQSFGSIAEQLKNEPTMTYKLLRYFNSAAAGLQKRIETLTEALVILGREKFYRWTSLLLFDLDNPDYRERVLAERALSRARALELIAGKGAVPKDGDNLFLVGLFSLLDRTLGRPLPELLEKAALPAVVRDALLGRGGAYADALALVVLGEADADTSPEQMVRALARCRIGYPEYARALAEAIDWAAQTLGEAA